MSEADSPSSSDPLVESDKDAPVWDGPFAERDKYGGFTGAYFVRCRGCGVEVLTGDKKHAWHRDGCPHA